MDDIRRLALPFRIGATSYSTAAGLVENARFLAPLVQEMQLVLFDRPGFSNLPAPAEIEELAAIGREHDLRYTVHLIDDLALHADGPAGALPVLHPGLQRSLHLIARFRPLEPWAFVLHLEARALREAGFAAAAMAGWQQARSAALTLLAAAVPAPGVLAVENLEGFPPGLVAPVVAAANAGRCVDVGHLWLDGVDPAPWLRAAGARLRVVHIHGVAVSDDVRRDHQSLAHMAAEELDAVIMTLLEIDYRGVLSMEVFEEADFRSSLAALSAACHRCQMRHQIWRPGS